MQSRRKLNVSFVIRDAQEPLHRGGINSIQYDANAKRLFTAGRDSVIRCWDVGGEQVSHVANMEHHADWVNDICLIADGANLVSVSSDTAVKLWDVRRGSCSVTVRTHHDYVKSVAYADQANKVLSAGLDHKIFIWDVQDLLSITAVKPTINTLPMVGHKSSVYSVAINPSATVAVSGGTENLVRLWDPRTGGRLCKLRGHADNVRAVAVSSDGTQCLSASTDGTVRLWSIGQQRCVMTVRCHQQGVWALLTDPDNFNCVYSAGRDGQVFVSDVRHSDQSELLVDGIAPVLKMVMDSEKRMWIATTESSISLWDVNNKTEHTDLCTPRCEKPVKTIGGSPAIVQYHVLNNRRHVLTKDSQDNVALWDVFLAKKLKELGKVNIEEELDKRAEMVYVPNWFTINAKTGLLNVTLTDSECSQAWVHATEAGFPDSGVALKLNLGAMLLRALFEKWKDPSVSEQNGHAGNEEDGGTEGGSQSSEVAPGNGYFSVPPHTTILISESGDAGATKHRLVAGCPSAEAELTAYDFPPWVHDIVFRDILPKFPRLSFILSPHKGSCLQPLRRDRLQAHDVLQIDKIADHVHEAMFVGTDALMTHWKDWEAYAKQPSAEVVELLCQDVLLKLSYDLRTVRYLIWKSGGDMQLTYRLVSEGTKGSPLGEQSGKQVAEK